MQKIFLLVLVMLYAGQIQAQDKTDTTSVYQTDKTQEMEEVVISSTRSSRTIRDIPTRVEFIAGEELDEKANMKPGDIRMVLSESTGIQVQTTSATSANASIRIQGLDGRYTQILKDGFPLYSGASSGLGLLQIPPLDLKQVEVIKGAASTLYGGGAIAGLVNLISKTPKDEQELKFHLNGTSAGGFDANGFYSKKFGKTGATIFAAHNRNAAYDPAGIDFSAIPKFERFTFNPRFFVYPNENTTISLGVNTAFEKRIGGDMHFIKNKNETGHSYFEKNKTERISTQFLFDHIFGEHEHFIVKNSVSYFNRKLTTPGYAFDGTQYSTFTEASYANHGDKLEWIAGANLWTDQFKEKAFVTGPKRDYNLNTLGAFAQNTWKAAEWMHVETGLRADYVVDYGLAFLPRISALLKFSPAFTSRIGGGLGYKAPTIFTEESERIQYQGVLGIDKDKNRLEHSYGGNWDVNYQTMLFNDRLSLSINQLFFYTYITKPLILKPTGNANYRFENISGHIDTRGTETNLKLGYSDFKLLMGYTYTDARIRENGRHQQNFLTPKHRINSVLFYEVEEKWKAGLEAYYFSKQQLSDGKTGQEYVILGFMVERLWERFSIYINFENFLDARQTRFDNIYTGSIATPTFRDIYAPLDGFVFNGGIKINL
ncbi:TonB-dependent receptor plug domain-containing protein [Dyadobacter fanqingshengii]|uniref:TonB-dependent receptor plug domain-containing protein n=1 Tax=Dyadobacter fanqingshengii TaxID=2906443 RepID=A0A9X1PBY8_9BACT|nr:TonB-dependent receptor [Dyadobacter fanqingshengii]MCF0040665.1 TonB-dependent receptor plug domain-containing protein [Dyadobacter fanqingshengii]USJ37597.1 TonB-dependent receptor plug domain-containing protein [Dyadobacter fanqingshengii]